MRLLRRTFGLMPALLLPTLASPIAFAQEGDTDIDPLELARASLDKHYELQQIIAKEESDWETGKQLLESRVDLLRAQIEETVEKTKEQSKDIKESDKSLAELSIKNEELALVVETQYEKVEELESRLRKLIPLLPQELRSKIQPIVDRLPKEGKKREEIKARIADRYLNVLGILKEVGNANSSISYAIETRKMRDGKTANVDTLYFGLGQAFYVGTGDRATEAGRGVPGPDGWVWTPLPKEADRIGNMMRIYQGTDEAAFIPLPMTVK